MVYSHSEKFRNSKNQKIRKSDGWGIGGMIKVNKVSAVSTVLLSGYLQCNRIIFIDQINIYCFLLPFLSLSYCMSISMDNLQ